MPRMLSPHERRILRLTDFAQRLQELRLDINGFQWENKERRDKILSMINDVWLQLLIAKDDENEEGKR